MFLDPRFKDLGPFIQAEEHMNVFMKTQRLRFAKKESKLECVVAEVNRYKSKECIENDKKPLVWWKMQEDQYPLMANLATRCFSIPATSVRSEEIFSVAGNISSEKCNRLLPGNVDELVFYLRI